MDQITAITELLKSKGEKITPARKAILEVLGNSSQLLSVAEIYEELRNNKINVNYSTVYRNLDVLNKNNVVEKITFPEGTKYKLQVEGQHLHHLICKSCHQTQVLPYCPFQELEDIIRAKTNFLPLEHKFEIYGYCEDCRKKINEEVNSPEK